MDLLFKRAQTPGGGGTGLAIPGLGMGAPKFKLWAKIELDPEEQIVLDHYHFDQAVLIDSFQPELMKKAAMLGGAVFVVATLFFWSMFSFTGALFWGLIAAGAAAWFYFDKKRETIFVRDLLHGRYFSCYSVVDLAHKEAKLETLSGILRQVMESAKHWGGTEAIKIEALPKDLAKQLIIQSL